MMKKRMLVLLTLLALTLVLVPAAAAQDSGLSISFSRDFGYSSGGGDIQGLFTVTARGPADLARVVFYIDRRVLGEADRPPFKYQFNTDNYPTGVHILHAEGATASGTVMRSVDISARFVTAAEGTQAGLRIAIPILAIVFGAMLLATLVPILTGRKTRELPAGTHRSYPLGGAICPKCGRPFAVHLYGLNLLGRKYDRCPYCGRWSIVSYASMDKLRAAEEAELAGAVTEGAGQVQGLSAEEKLKQELDESRYHDL
jgi:DNA-directed RNA polymerase subunit RPC12/RpoP